MRDVPQNWSRELLKRRVRFAYGESLASENRNEGDVPVFGSNGMVGIHDRSITHAPAIIIGRKGSSGKVTWSDNPCFPIDTTYFVDRTQTKEDMRWVFYALESLELDKINFDSAVPGLSRELAYSLPLFFPPFPEQQRIAAYLDASCAAIDAAVAAKRRQIETLDAFRKTSIHRVVTQGVNSGVEMQKTDVEWLPTVPKHWRVARVKDVL
jgi:type I restriction enzyme S subunit